jgi:hypothetical protein
MVDSEIAIPAILHEHLLPAMGSPFPESRMLSGRLPPCRCVASMGQE